MTCINVRALGACSNYLKISWGKGHGHIPHSAWRDGSTPRKRLLVRYRTTQQNSRPVIGIGKTGEAGGAFLHLGLAATREQSLQWITKAPVLPGRRNNLSTPCLHFATSRVRTTVARAFLRHHFI